MYRHWRLWLVAVLALIAGGLFIYSERSNQSKTKLISKDQTSTARSKLFNADVRPITITGDPASKPGTPNTTSRVISLSTLSTSATVQVGNQPWSFSANAMGSFPSVTVPRKAAIPIHLKVGSYETIQELVLDGGRLDNGTIAQMQTADKAGDIEFEFQVKSPPGAYRVAIYRMGLRQVFRFWVGPPLPPRVMPRQIIN